MTKIFVDRDQIPDGGACEAWFDQADAGSSVIVARRGDTVRAWRNICPHAGRFLNWAPGKFLFSKQGDLVCAAHGAVFRVDDGLCTDGPCRGSSLLPVPVEHLADGRVCLRDPDATASAAAAGIAQDSPETG